MPQQPKLSQKFKDCMWDSARRIRTRPSALGVHLWGNRRGIVAKYAVGPQLDMFLDLFRKRDPQAATTRPSFLDDPRLSLGDGPASASFHAYGSAITRHQSPLSTGDRSGVTGDTLGSEARPTGEEYESQASGDWRPLSSIPEGEEGDPPSPNATDGVRRGPGPSCPEASRVSKARLAC